MKENIKGKTKLEAILFPGLGLRYCWGNYGGRSPVGRKIFWF